MRNVPLLIQALVDADVDFVLVGGFAVQLHGFVRSTLDLDIALAMDEGNLSRFIAVAERFGLQPMAPVPLHALKDRAQVESWVRDKGLIAFSLREPQPEGMVVDLLVRPVVPQAELRQRATRVRLFDRDVALASLDDLIAMKIEANRPKDRIDLEALKKIQRGEDPNG